MKKLTLGIGAVLLGLASLSAPIKADVPIDPNDPDFEARCDPAHQVCMPLPPPAPCWPHCGGPGPERTPPTNKPPNKPPNRN
jgi:hypothetical protein